VATKIASFGFKRQFDYSCFVGRKMRPTSVLCCRVRSFRKSKSTQTLKV